MIEEIRDERKEEIHLRRLLDCDIVLSRQARRYEKQIREVRHKPERGGRLCGDQTTLYSTHNGQALVVIT